VFVVLECVCGADDAQFGPVEKIQLDEASTDGVVYIHFKSVLSALNVSVFGRACCLCCLTLVCRLSTGSRRDGSTETERSVPATTMSASFMQACWSTRAGRSTYAFEYYSRIDMSRGTSRTEVQ
jgi:hypothetical protein